LRGFQLSIDFGHIFTQTNSLGGLNPEQWRAEGGANGATTPGIHSRGGIQGPVS